MRIVGGRHRGRVLRAPAGRDVRPTADRTRESLFNILEHGHSKPGGGSPLTGATVLDAFAGTGAMGLEALSRGAARALFMENAAPALAALRANIAACGEEARCEIVRADATHPPRARTACAIAFLDPPYGKGLAEAALSALAKAGWLADGAISTVELAEADDFTAPEGFEQVDERRYGAARIILLNFAGG
jgi:16S rRNA (guanine966-N2)-methyltransferase